MKTTPSRSPPHMLWAGSRPVECTEVKTAEKRGKEREEERVERREKRKGERRGESREERELRRERGKRREKRREGRGEKGERREERGEKEDSKEEWEEKQGAGAKKPKHEVSARTVSQGRTGLRDAKRRRTTKEEAREGQRDGESEFRTWLTKEGFVLHDSLDLRFSGSLKDGGVFAKKAMRRGEVDF
eukprot:755205-Hanusia_phi.AAC.3